MLFRSGYATRTSPLVSSRSLGIGRKHTPGQLAEGGHLLLAVAAPKVHGRAQQAHCDGVALSAVLSTMLVLLLALCLLCAAVLSVEKEGSVVVVQG